MLAALDSSAHCLPSGRYRVKLLRSTRMGSVEVYPKDGVRSTSQDHYTQRLTHEWIDCVSEDLFHVLIYLPIRGEGADVQFSRESKEGSVSFSHGNDFFQSTFLRLVKSCQKDKGYNEQKHAYVLHVFFSFESVC